MFLHRSLQGKISVLYISGKLHRTTHLQQSPVSSSLLSICMAATVRSEIRFCPCILHKHYSSKRCYDASGKPSRRQSHDQEALSLWSLCTLQCHPILAVAIHGSWVSQHRSPVQCSSTLQWNTIMTLHPVPFSVGVSLGLSLGRVPESELLNPSLKTRSCTSSKGFTTNAFSSDFIRLLAMLLTKLQESGQAAVRPLPQRNTKTSPEAAILCHSFVLHALLA